MFWQTSRFRIDLTRPRVMGIVNVTPDSFSDGGSHGNAASAAAHCEQLLKEGVDILDIGGESSRPGAQPVSGDDEWARVQLVLKSALTLRCPVSIDTAKTEVMQRALDLGVDIVNDINALRAPGAMEVVAAHPNCGVCLMHMQGEPRSMQSAPAYDDVLVTVRDFLASQVAQLRAHDVAEERIVLDPGYGFGKSIEHNLALFRRQRELLQLGHPLLIGWSRKSTLGVLTGRGPGERMVASVAAALAAVELGASVVRVHDVAATVDALKIWEAAGLA
jgi:dihydropteroate synthase